MTRAFPPLPIVLVHAGSHYGWDPVFVLSSLYYSNRFRVATPTRKDVSDSSDGTGNAGLGWKNARGPLLAGAFVIGLGAGVALTR